MLNLTKTIAVVAKRCWLSLKYTLSEEVPEQEGNLWNICIDTFRRQFQTEGNKSFSFIHAYSRYFRLPRKLNVYWYFLQVENLENRSGFRRDF